MFASFKGEVIYNTIPKDADSLSTLSDGFAHSFDSTRRAATFHIVYYVAHLKLRQRIRGERTLESGVSGRAQGLPQQRTTLSLRTT